MKYRQNQPSLIQAAAQAGMDVKTARKYLKAGRLPSQMKVDHTWATREDPFAEVWDEVKLMLENNAGLEAKTLFEELQRKYPGRFADGQVRTLQRRVKVWPSSTIHVLHNTYTVGSRLIGEQVEARVYARHLEIWYAQHCLEKMPRLRGERKYRIDYRHLIGWLVRKPGAFANYRYRAELFPSSQFRMAYEVLQEQIPSQADREYLQILYLAAQEGESRVEEILRSRLHREERIDAKSIQSQLEGEGGLVFAPPTVEIGPVDLRVYDRLMEEEVSSGVH